MTAYALIDGDIVAFRSAVTQESAYRWDEQTTSHAMLGDSKTAARNAVDLTWAWAKLAGLKNVRVCFTGRTNFRKALLPTYKANRAGKVKPVAFGYTVEALCERFQTDLVEGLEGDDLLGVLATNPKYQGSVIQSLDKDMRSLPGLIMNPLKDTKPFHVSPRQADTNWLTQALTGDTADGYTGIPRIGPAKAAKILGGLALATEHWPRVRQAYAAAGLSEEHALTQARVARILRHDDYRKGPPREVRLWTPDGGEWIQLDNLLAPRADAGRVVSTTDQLETTP